MKNRIAGFPTFAKVSGKRGKHGDSHKTHKTHGK
jgi:hypothetical protein